MSEPASNQLDPSKCLILSPHLRGTGKSYSWQEAQIKVGHVLADQWLPERHGSIDIWGVDDYGELTYMTFLGRVYEVDKSLDTVGQVKWYFNCGTFDLGLPPDLSTRFG